MADATYRLFLRLKPTGWDEQVEVFTGSNVWIKRRDKIDALESCRGNPRKLQNLLLTKVFGEEYIRSHCATGQRLDSNGNPAADKNVLQAISNFVRCKFRGEKDLPTINRAFNSLSNNLRVKQRRQMGLLKRSQRRPKSAQLP
ncbi:uncharacterized protein LOC124171792 [Ischnura elegans]|uniref:uncharacterized protein LOC124171792 n=1 Tax=Ischnura elegans TaxID=197161 RepID=UPI001ED88C19|nr:uncharacterized protein LOC124171792 [Ischnura elegans]